MFQTKHASVDLSKTALLRVIKRKTDEDDVRFSVTDVIEYITNHKPRSCLQRYNRWKKYHQTHELVVNEEHTCFEGSVNNIIVANYEKLGQILEQLELVANEKEPIAGECDNKSKCDSNSNNNNSYILNVCESNNEKERQNKKDNQEKDNIDISVILEPDRIQKTPVISHTNNMNKVIGEQTNRDNVRSNATSSSPTFTSQPRRKRKHDGVL